MLLQRPLPRRTAGCAARVLRHAAAGDHEYMRRQAVERFDQITAALRQLPRSVLLVIRWVRRPAGRRGSGRRMAGCVVSATKLARLAGLDVPRLLCTYIQLLSPVGRQAR